MISSRKLISIVRTAGALAVICVSVAGMAAPAGASDSSEVAHLPAAVSWPSSSGRQSSAATAEIVCNPNVQNPHNSTHVNGTVNVVVTIGCTNVVPEITIRAALYRNGLLVADSGLRSVFGNNFAQTNAAVPCQDATYQGWMYYGVNFPPGYVPPFGSSSGFGNSVPIVC
jgi:hypothetical protein